MFVFGLTCEHQFGYCGWVDTGSHRSGVEAALLGALDVLLGVPAGEGVVSSAGNVAGVLDSWGLLRVGGDVSAWSSVDARVGLVVLEGVARSVAAMRCLLLGRVGLDRDSVAGLCRSTGVSSRDARVAVRAARVVDLVPAVGELLAAGSVSVGQVSAVAGLDADDAVGLLTAGVGDGDDDFRVRVEKFKVELEGGMRADRQRASRYLRFGEGPDGCVRLSGLLPPVEGAEVMGALDGLCDAAYRKEHPERARTLGGHKVEDRGRRLADALVSLCRGDSAGGGQPAVVVVVDAVTLESTLLPDTPLHRSELVGLLDRAELFAAIRDHTVPARLVFGRNRRLASLMQRLALMVDQPFCVVPGCRVPASQCEMHHLVEFADGGMTDLPNLVFLCSGHHQHHHRHTRNDRSGDRGGGGDSDGDGDSKGDSSDCAA